MVGTKNAIAGSGIVQWLLLGILLVMALSIVMFQHSSTLLLDQQKQRSRNRHTLETMSLLAPIDLKGIVTTTAAPQPSSSGQPTEASNPLLRGGTVGVHQQQQQHQPRRPLGTKVLEGSPSYLISEELEGYHFPTDASTRLLLASSTPKEPLLKVRGQGEEAQLWAKREFQRRKPRKGQMTNTELYEAVAREATNITVLWPSVPSVVNQFPTCLQQNPGTGDAMFDLGKAWGSWKVSFFQDLKEAKGPPQRNPAEPPLYVASFSPGIAHQGHVMSSQGKVYTSGGCLWEFSLPAGFSKKSKGDSQAVSPVQQEPGWRALQAKGVLPVAVSLCDGWCKGYYHFTHEHLPRVALVYDALTQKREQKDTGREGSYLVLSHGMNGFQKDFLIDILGIPSQRIKTGTHMASTILYPMPLRCGNTFTSALYMIREIVFRRLELGEFSPQSMRASGTSESEKGIIKRQFGIGDDGNDNVKLRVLWAERRKLSRMASNFYELKAQLEEEFDLVATFDTTVGEHHARVQVAKFYHADIVIGPHGANIANLMWMVPGTTVIEMASKAKGNMCYYTTASRINVSYHTMLHDSGKDGKYTLEYQDLRRHFVSAVHDVAVRFGVAQVLKNLEVLRARGKKE